jgi:hypothetical protein
LQGWAPSGAEILVPRIPDSTPFFPCFSKQFT